MQNKSIHMVAFTLLVVGGINWGLVGLLNFDLVQWIFVDLIGMQVLATVVYVLVGISALYEVATHKGSCVHCGAGAGNTRTQGGGASPMGGDMTHG